MKYIKWGGLAIFIIILISVFSIGIHSITSFFTNGFVINTNSTAVVKELQALNRWETESYTIEKVITAGTNGNVFQQFLFGDKILLIAHGEVIAGFNLAQISGKDVSVDGTTITVTLPKPQILITKLDNDKTQVYDRQRGLLAPSDNNLESQARLAAEKSIQDGACQETILTAASDNARKQLTSMLKAAGFTNITVNIPQGSC